MSTKNENRRVDSTGNKRYPLLVAVILLGLLGNLLAAFGVFIEFRSIIWAVSIWLMVVGMAVLAGVWYRGKAASTSITIPPIEDETSRRRAAMYAFFIAIVVGLLFIIIFAIGSGDITKFVSISSVGVMIAGASLLVGALLGFLFGIPRTLQQDGLTQPTQQPSPVVDVAGKMVNEWTQKPGYAVNTNLEQISDWLTKILVGVGLTQITVMPEKMWMFAGRLSVGLGDASGNVVLALTIMIFFSVCGFMGGYLWTRLYLAGAFRRADTEDVAQLKKQASTIEGKLDEHRQVMENDARALASALGQLNVDTPDILQEELNDVIKSASKSTKSSIYIQAQTQRSRSWQGDKPSMERTIPLFIALSESDPSCHQYHGQLGYAYKDRIPPSLDKAITEFDKAIEYRGPWKDRGYLLYEFNRALARIMLEQKKPEQSLPPAATDLIVTDLKAAFSKKYFLEIVKKIDFVKVWMAANNVTIDKILSQDSTDGASSSEETTS